MAWCHEFKVFYTIRALEEYLEDVSSKQDRLKQLDPKISFAITTALERLAAICASKQENM